MLIFGLHSISDDQLGCSIDLNLVCHPSPAKKIKSSFWITFNFWWSDGLVDGLEPYLPPLSSQKNKMLVFGLHSISEDRLGCSIDFEPCLPPLSSQKNKILIFGLRSTSDDRSGWSMDSKSVCHPSPVKQIKCSFLDYVQLLMIGRAGWWSRTHLPPLSSHKNKMLIFGLCSTSDDWPCWSMDSKPICHPSPAKKIKCLFLDYIQLLMIGQTGWWTQTPSATPL